jgi:hypothetical protein
MYYASRRREIHKRFWWGNLKQRDDIEFLDVDGKIISERILKKYDRRLWPVFILLGIQQAADSRRHEDGGWVSTKCG